MGRVGSLEFLPYIIKSYINDYFSERVVFNTQMSLSLYRWEDVKAEAEKILARSSILNKQRILEKLETLLKNERQYKATQDMLKPDISENRKMSEIRYLKNANYHPGIPVYLSIVRDVNASPTIRQGLLESLAWFSLSEQKGAIVEVCKELMQDMKQDTRIRQEAERTYYRLTEQIKNR